MAPRKRNPVVGKEKQTKSEMKALFIQLHLKHPALLSVSVLEHMSVYFQKAHKEVIVLAVSMVV